MAGYGKITKAELETRIQRIAELMVQGIRSNRRIILYIREADRKAREIIGDREREEVDLEELAPWGWPWEVGSDQLHKYIDRASELFRMDARSDFNHERALLLEQIENVFTASLRVGRYGSAIRALREKMYLLGVGEVGVNVPGLERLVQALEAGAERKPILPQMTREVVPIGVNGNGSHNGDGRNGHSTP